MFRTPSPDGDLLRLWRRSELLIFDFDGVLADSEPWFRRSWNHALSLWGHSISEQDYWLYWSSLGQGLEGEISRRGLEGIDTERAKELQQTTYEGYCREGRIPLFPGVVDLLERLSAGRCRRRWCIASNTVSDLVRTVLTSNGGFVPEIIGGEGLPAKPAPDIFLRAAETFGVDPRNALVFEDSQKGVSAAMEGGFPYVLVRNSRNRHLDISSEACLEDIGGLLQVMDSESTAV